MEKRCPGADFRQPPRIADWRHKEALRATYLQRPDMLENYELNAEEQKMLAEIKEEEN